MGSRRFLLGLDLTESQQFAERFWISYTLDVLEWEYTEGIVRSVDILE